MIPIKDKYKKNICISIEFISCVLINKEMPLKWIWYVECVTK